MEYMASGTPLVAFDLPCIPDEYKSYFYMLEDYNADSIRQVLEMLLNEDSYKLHSFGKVSQRWITEAKNPEVQVKKYVDKIVKDLEI
jgi:glycosyltransferase involved in cell wall biosynthesis